MHQLSSQAFICLIFLFLLSLARGTGSGPEIATFEVLHFSLLHNSLYSLFRTSPFPTYEDGTNMRYDLWLLTLPLQNVLQLLRDVFDPGPREATHHPGVSIAATEMPVCASN